MTFTETITLTKIDCGKCGGSYAINERYRKEREETGGHWVCPYCQVSWGYGLSENQKLKKELEQKEIQLRQAKCETLAEKQLREAAELQKSQLNRKLDRVHKGVCPCCKRSFQNLQRHMATKHPEKVKV